MEPSDGELKWGLDEGLTIRRTDSRHCASWMASEQDVVVLPVDRNVEDTS